MTASRKGHPANKNGRKKTHNYLGEEQCCSCFFVSGRTVVYRSYYKRPKFPPKVDFGGPNYRLQASHVASHVDWPNRTLLTARPARQDAVLLRRMTTTALENSKTTDAKTTRKMKKKN